MASPRPTGAPDPVPSILPGALEHAVEVRLALVRERYGDRLDTAALEALRPTIEGIVRDARALQAVRLSNADEPAQPFAPFRADP